MSLAGRLVYQFWHRPIGAVRHSLRHGGPLAQRAAARGEREMRAAAATLPLLPALHSANEATKSTGRRDDGPQTTNAKCRMPNAECQSPDSSPFAIRHSPFVISSPLSALPVHFLTGRRFVHQTAFCLHTLARHCPRPVLPEIYDDGSLDPEATAMLRRLAPALVVHEAGTLAARLDEFLPARHFPVLRERWANYPHIRKLIDVHLGRTGWRLVLDSDLLFWREPRFLLDWAAAPDRPLHAEDCAENYGYSRPLLERIAGAPLPARVNVGLCGLRSEALDWEFLEHATATFIATERTSYYLEQALVAVLAARLGPCAVAPAADYVTLPSAAEIARPTAVMHHYVDTSRGAYFRHAWRRALGTAPATAPQSAS